MQIQGDCQNLNALNDDAGALIRALSPLAGLRCVILGVGHVFKGDDAAGPMVCEKVAGRVSVPVIDAGPVPENYLGSILSRIPDHVLIIDAMILGVPPGTIKVLSRSDVPLLGSTTHSLSLRLLADNLAAGLPAEVTFVGLQPAHIGLGRPVSPEVERAVEIVTDVLHRLFPADIRQDMP